MEGQRLREEPYISATHAGTYIQPGRLLISEGSWRKYTRSQSVGWRLMRSPGQDSPDPTDYTGLPHPSRILTLLQLRAGREQAKAAALQSLPWSEGKDLGQVWINPPPCCNSEPEEGKSMRGNHSYLTRAGQSDCHCRAEPEDSELSRVPRGEHGERILHGATPSTPRSGSQPGTPPATYQKTKPTKRKSRRSPFGEKDQWVLLHS